MKLEGKILGAELASAISGAHVCLKDQEGKIISRTISNSEGFWSIDCETNGVFLHFDACGYIEKSLKVVNCPIIIRLLEDKLIGYQDKLWFVPGDSVNVYVHSSTTYQCKLFRHGLAKENILDLGEFNPCIQTVPDNFFVDEGLGWTSSFSYDIPHDASPGLYSLLLSSIGQEPFAIPMIISPLRKEYGQRSKILVLASTNNWQCYNIWGGRSRYRNFEKQFSDDFIDFDASSLQYRLKKIVARFLPKSFKRFIKNKILKDKFLNQVWCFDKLTIKRPFTNCALEEKTAYQPFTNHLAAGEWRVLAWLEREGFEYDIISGYQLHDNPDLLNNYHAIIFSTHCEYWSKEMYEAVFRYHNHNGLWVINLSGNTLYRAVDFYEDGSLRCVSLHFSEKIADETQLLGVRFSDEDYGTCAPFKIVDPTHWAFHNAPVNTHSLFFGGLSLNQNTCVRMSRYDSGRPGVKNGLKGMGASGWETDKLSKTAPNDMYIIAKGMNKGGGADMVVREPNGTRGGMFSASSLVFGGSLLIDDVSSTVSKKIIQKALKRVF